ncbi:peroxisomal membrane protein 11C isoform X1 [Alligator mississippiensis]|uniref:peroxisomal membrane protein 11C isoform X1 n=1 Tax=Alligator mississippiensis TaxID=8496 RepID=UPI0028775936|nr:peroxisomal membrane protein 11C isoform X1 [Alligator mississippiensis]
MAAPLCGLVSALETCRGRDRLMRTLCYGCQLVGGAVAAARQGPAEPPLAQSLLAASAQLSQCRTVLRLFDGPAMLSHTRHYGLGPTEEDAVVRWLSVLGNVADQLYYPCEHVAWAADAGVLRARSRRWWALSTALWGLSLLLGILRSLRILSRLRRRMRARTGESPQERLKRMKAQMKSEVLSILSSMADLSNAIHWLPPGFLWAGRFPPWLVGLMGTISSLVGVYQTYVGENAGTV